MRFFIVANFLSVSCCRVPALPRSGEIVMASELDIEPGGKGLNVAMGTRKLGAEVTALVGIGDDAEGDGLVQLMHAHGMDTGHVHRLAPRSGFGMGFIGHDGANCGAVLAGPNLLLNRRHAEQAHSAISSAQWVYGQFEAALEAVEGCFDIARQAGVATMLNPSPWQAIPQTLLALTDVLLVNELEAGKLLNTAVAPHDDLVRVAADLAGAVQALWATWPGRVLVVTLGERGSLAWARGQAPWITPAMPVHTVDTLGAGDAFASGLLASLGQGRDWPQALRFATACGAIMASRSGVLASLPTQQAVMDFLAGHREAIDM